MAHQQTAEQSSGNVSRRILISFILSALIPIVTIYLVSYNQISSQLDNEIRRQLYETSRSLGLSVYDRLLSAELNMKIIAGGFENGSRPDTLVQNELLGTIFSGMSVFDSSGLVETLFGSDSTTPVPGSAQTRHMASGNTALMISARSGEEPSMILLRRISDSVYGRPAILAATIRPDYLWDFPVYAPELVCIFDADSHPLFCSMLINPEDTAHLSDRALSGQSSSPAQWTFDGTDYSAQRWDIFLRARYALPDISVVIAAPRTSVFMSFDDFKQTFPKILIITGLLVALLSISQIRKTLGPLQKLAAATRRIGQGNYSEPVQIDSRDEFGLLADSFNQMAEQIEQQIRTISTMAEIDRLILSSTDSEYILETLARYLKDITRAERVCLITLDPAGTGMARLYQINKTGDITPRNYELRLSPEERIEIENAEQFLRIDEPFSRAWLREAATPEVRYFIAFPIHIHNQLSALICLGQSTRPEPDLRTLQWIKELSDRTAVALSSALREEKLFNQSHYDALTGLPNRFLFKDRLNLLLERSTRTGKCIALILLDLDHFKQINDTLGHEGGDLLLSRLGTELKGLVPLQGSLARAGGDEFKIFIPDLADSDSAASEAGKFAEDLMDRFSRPVELDGKPVKLTFSVGIALFPRDARNYEDLRKAAEMAMYEAKSAGRNTWRFFNREQDRHLQERTRLQNQFQQALEKNELSLFYQPKIACRTGRVTGVEALLRWQHPEKGLVSPGELLPDLMRSGLSVQINDWIIEQACLQHKALLEAGVHNLVLAVNLPAERLRDPKMAEKVAVVLSRTGLPADHLMLEISEASAIEDFEQARGIAEQLKQLGAGITIDDFGRGYSSLSSLQKIPADSLKIDRSFISRLSSGSGSYQIVSAIVTLAHNLGMTVIAEGVENQSQCDLLLELGCDELQGHLITQPLSGPNFRLFMLRESAFSSEPAAD